MGGLGRSISAWMVRHGARHLAFLPRSCATSPDTASTIRSLNSQGLATTAIQCDISVKREVEVAIKQIASKGVVKGIIQVAMVLDVSVNKLAVLSCNLNHKANRTSRSNQQPSSSFSVCLDQKYRVLSISTRQLYTCRLTSLS